MESTHVGDLEVDGAIGVEDVVEQVAVAVVASNLGLESGAVFERLGSGGELSLKVLRAAGSDSLEFVVVAVLDLLLVVVGQNLVFDVRVVLGCADRGSLLVCCFDVAHAHLDGMLGAGVLYQPPIALARDDKFWLRATFANSLTTTKLAGLGHVCCNLQLRIPLILAGHPLPANSIIITHRHIFLLCNHISFHIVQEFLL